MSAMNAQEGQNNKPDGANPRSRELRGCLRSWTAGRTPVRNLRLSTARGRASTANSCKRGQLPSRPRPTLNAKYFSYLRERVRVRDRVWSPGLCATNRFDKELHTNDTFYEGVQTNHTRGED